MATLSSLNACALPRAAAAAPPPPRARARARAAPPPWNLRIIDLNYYITAAARRCRRRRAAAGAHAVRERTIMPKKLQRPVHRMVAA
jgi:hypothetical protein